MRILQYGLLALFLTYGLLAATWGLSSDNDAELLMQAAGHLAATGEYARSRTSGFPLYEGLAAAMLSIGQGVHAINLLSLAMALMALQLAGRIAGRDQAERSLWAKILFLTYPVFIIAGSETMETMASILFALWLVSAVLVQPRLAWHHALIAMLLVLTRLDAALLVVAISVVAVTRQQLRLLRALIWLGLTGLACLALYSGLNGGLEFLSVQSLGFDGFMRRLVRAAAGIVNALQPAGWLGLAVLIWQGRQKSLVARSDWQAHLVQITLWASLFYALRFLALPDEIFYLVIPCCLWLLVIAVLVQSRAALTWIVAMSLAQCCVSFSLFARVPGPADTLVVMPAINPGPLWQERNQRLAFQAIRDPARLQRISCHFYSDCPALGIDHTAPFLVTADGRRVLVSDRYLYVFFSNRYPALNHGAHKEATVCRDEVVPSVSGWRVWQPAIPVYWVDVLAAGVEPDCWKVSLS